MFTLLNIIYSYKYLESDSIKHCHVIFIHSLGQPLIIRSHSKVHHLQGNPKEIPTWASRVSNYSYFPWFNRQQTWRVFNHFESVTKLHVFNHLASVAKPQVFYYLVSGAKLRYNIPIITLVGVWPDEWINITWQCFIKSDSRYLYEYIIL